MKFAWIEAHRAEFEIEAMCRVLEVSPSGFYARLKRPSCERAKRREELLCEIRRSHQESRQVYGSPRVYEDLKNRNVKVCENTVAKLMKEAQIRSKIVKKFVPKTTDSKHGFSVAGNVLDQDFQADRPDRKWVADITYIQTGEGWLYLAAVLDVCSRKVLGWSMAEHLKTELVEDALRMALSRRKPDPGLLHHSDRGVQYASTQYRTLLRANGLECSMSRAGNCYDNAVMESFWGTLKTEWVYHQKYATRNEARSSIFEYIEMFYNRVRRHSSLGYVSPEAFEAALN